MKSQRVLFLKIAKCRRDEERKNERLAKLIKVSGGDTFNANHRRLDSSRVQSICIKSFSRFNLRGLLCPFNYKGFLFVILPYCASLALCVVVAGVRTSIGRLIAWSDLLMGGQVDAEEGGNQMRLRER